MSKKGKQALEHKLMITKLKSIYKVVSVSCDPAFKYNVCSSSYDYEYDFEIDQTSSP